MKQGMLWYDNQTKQTIEKRLQEAVDYFIVKYGYPPLCCFVNPDMLSAPMKTKENIKVIPNEKILKDHFWLEMAQE